MVLFGSLPYLFQVILNLWGIITAYKDTSFSAKEAYSAHSFVRGHQYQQLRKAVFFCKYMALFILLINFLHLQLLQRKYWRVS